MCKISVVTSVYNCEQFIAETIISVQNQSMQDWEYILIDDCSSDQSVEIMKTFAAHDSRIKVIVNKENEGQSSNLNKGIRLACGKYIARLDHDDMCDPLRFEKQYAYMENHPNTVLVGSEWRTWKNGKVFDKRHTPVKSAQEMRFALFFCNLIPHSSFFIRKSILIEHGVWYREDYIYSEDFALLSDLLNFGDISLLNEYLITYRVFPDQATQRYSVELKKSEVKRVLQHNLETFQLPDKEIYEKAINGQLLSKSDVERFEKLLFGLGTRCELGSDDESIASNACVKDVYQQVYAMQKRTPKMMELYAHSKFRKRNWLFSRWGLGSIKHSIIDK